MNYQEKNLIVNQIHAIRRELTTLENLIWRLHNAETQASQSETETQAPPEAQGKPQGFPRSTRYRSFQR